MKIALVQSIDMHLCCVGFLCELFKGNEISLYTGGDSFRDIKYFKKIYDFNDLSISSINPNNYDLIIKITSNDNISLNVKDNKLFAILHVNGNEYNLKHFITLSPYIKLNDNGVQILPIYRGISYDGEIYKNIVYIGYFLNHYLDDDLKTFIENSKYNFRFIIWGDNGTEELFEKYKNVNVIRNLDTTSMINMINESSFVLCRKLPYQRLDRPSFMYTLALSHKKPLILQKSIAYDHNIPSFNFNSNYCELINELNTITTDEYNKYVDELSIFREKTINDNKNKMDEYIKKIL